MAFFDEVPKEQGSETRELIKGLFTVWGLNLVQLVVSVLAIAIWLGIYGLYFFGAVQLIFVVPMAISAVREKNSGRIKGIVLAAAVTAMLDVACSSQIGAPWRF
jgi:hypothetical protein